MKYGFWDEIITHDFYYNLAEEMIEIEYKRDGSKTRRGVSRRYKAPPTFYLIYHATPTKRKRKKYMEKVTFH